MLFQGLTSNPSSLAASVNRLSKHMTDSRSTFSWVGKKLLRVIDDRGKELLVVKELKETKK